MNELLITLVTIAVAVGGILMGCNYLIFTERKLAAWMQDRVGPNRVGPWGLLQPMADGLKFLLKEDVIPGHVDKALFLIAPTISVLTTRKAWPTAPSMLLLAAISLLPSRIFSN